MNVSKDFSVNIRNSLSSRLLKIVLSIYIAVTLVVTVMHVLIEYDSVKKNVHGELVTVQRTFADSLSQALWQLDREQLNVTVDGITELPAIIGASIYGLDGVVIASAGQIEDTENPKNKSVFWHEFPLQYRFGNDIQEIGLARLYSSNQIVIDRIKLGIVILTVNAIIKTVVLFFLIVIVFDRILTRPLGKLAKDADGIDPDNIQAERIRVSKNEGDEINLLENSLNAMMDKVSLSIKELDNLNKNLEDKVKKRTASLNDVIVQLDKEQRALVEEVSARMEKEKALEESRKQVQESLDNLRQAQEQLIESEKMASLGNLVAGVAHEINTPVGLSLTGITHFQFLVERLSKRYKDGELEEEQFEKFLNDSQELARSIVISLNRAADLVRSFKQVAVDQSHDTIRTFQANSYIHEVLLSHQNILKQTKIKVEVLCDEALAVTSFPGIWSQVITNFLSNALIHGYDKGAEGKIEISFKAVGDQWEFRFSDNGKGMSEETSKKVFEPFFTTNRENGGSGLGMNIVYNLVTQKLHGRIDLKSSLGVGTEYTILVPKDIGNPGQNSQAG
ncbi:signal transduction histidine kinase [Oleiphilus messinensis]|uniref:histidine kinase n=1 Tax=Oleiphilus messinensis TaxID=141451 RepID=A0A1Y0IA05_9GAMM|nr:ATP-binding protein [Oleiphilus messinensis]ARU56254.1 signal transduction histidine kinase [Oleiphilus messinensis]